jgi:hypothetical protein
MKNSERILAFKRLYVAANTLVHNIYNLLSQQNVLDEQGVDKAITYMDEMIALLPISFPGEDADPFLMINLNDPEKEIVIGENERVQDIPPDDENVRVVYESSIQYVLEDWKFLLWNYVTLKAPGQSSNEKYKPLMLTQAEICLALFPDSSATWAARKQVILYFKRKYNRQI